MAGCLASPRPMMTDAQVLCDGWKGQPLVAVGVRLARQERIEGLGQVGYGLRLFERQGHQDAPISSPLKARSRMAGRRASISAAVSA
jgi:hypothetical protein